MHQIFTRQSLRFRSLLIPYSNGQSQQRMQLLLQMRQLPKMTGTSKMIGNRVSDPPKKLSSGAG